MNRPLSRSVTIASLALAALAGVIVFHYHYTITDWWFLRSYHPPARIAQLAEQAQLTSAGRDMLYRAQPQIVTQRAEMTSHCQIDDKEVAELGCYLGDEHIYLLDVNEPALANEMIVTAAYEMLHPVYQRLGATERRQLDARLEAVAAHITDPSILSQIAIYAKTEPGERDDELYSVLGTEYPTLTPELEANYARYLGNRDLLVSYHASFEHAFSDLSARIAQLNDQINSARAKLKQYEASGQIARYNALVPGINAQIDEYNEDIATYNRYGQAILGAQNTTSPQ